MGRTGGVVAGLPLLAARRRRADARHDVGPDRGAGVPTADKLRRYGQANRAGGRAVGWVELKAVRAGRLSEPESEQRLAPCAALVAEPTGTGRAPGAP